MLCFVHHIRVFLPQLLTLCSSPSKTVFMIANNSIVARYLKITVQNIAKRKKKALFALCRVLSSIYSMLLTSLTVAFLAHGYFFNIDWPKTGNFEVF